MEGQQLALWTSPLNPRLCVSNDRRSVLMLRNYALRNVKILYDTDFEDDAWWYKSTKGDPRVWRSSGLPGHTCRV